MDPRQAAVRDTFPIIAGPSLAPFQADAALAFLETADRALDPRTARRDAHLLGRLWRWRDESAARTPVLQNTDGDPLELHTATFLVADAAALARALQRRENLEFDDAEGTWGWLGPDPSGPGEDLGRRVLGRFELLGDRLVLEVNSARRFERARAWLDALPACASSARRSGDSGLPATPPRGRATTACPTHRVRPPRRRSARCTSSSRSSWHGAGSRARSRCSAASRRARRAGRHRGRARVARLVRTMPAIGTPAGLVEPPREELLRELGIEGA